MPPCKMNLLFSYFSMQTCAVLVGPKNEAHEEGQIQNGRHIHDAVHNFIIFR